MPEAKDSLPAMLLMKFFWQSGGLLHLATYRFR
jgi:hypothetical protein